LGLCQTAALATLISVAHWTWLPATLVAVELAVLHNFLWHERWTWGDQTVARVSSLAVLQRLLRFHAANGLVSIAGNAALMALLVAVVGMPAVIANVLAVGVMSIANFMMADRWVFRSPASLKPGAALACWRNRVASVAPTCLERHQPETVAAWQRYVARRKRDFGRRARRLARTRKNECDWYAGSSIHIRWHAALARSVFIPDHARRLLHGLQHPARCRPRKTSSSRVLERGPDARACRSPCPSRDRHGDLDHSTDAVPALDAAPATRSVATRIEESGDDHGSVAPALYWRYEETGGGVMVDLESLTSAGTHRRSSGHCRPLVNSIARVNGKDAHGAEKHAINW
jgi:putative flippase GtrA